MFDVMDFGAKGDGISDDTKVIYVKFYCMLSQNILFIQHFLHDNCELIKVFHLHLFQSLHIFF